MLSPNTILQNRYCVVRKLGEGGMGAVYEAIDQSVSCVVALKETLVSDESETRFSFQREAALLANLRHPALPKVMDYFVDHEGQFLVMEYIPGHDLAELLELRGGSFPQDQVLHWADELLKVLEYLHSRQPPILHRDIKPANLKLTKQGEIFLLDFGLAKGAADWRAYSGLGSVYFHEGRYVDAEVACKRAIALKANDAYLYKLLAGIYESEYVRLPEAATAERKRKLDEWIPALARAVELDPSEKYDYGYHELAGLYERAKLFDRAIATYKRLLIVLPPSAVGKIADTHQSMARVYEHANRFAEAIDEYKECIRLKPNEADYYFHLGDAYVEAKRYPEAIEAYQQAKRLRSTNDALADIRIGEVYIEAADYDKAVEVLTRATQLEPGNWEPFADLGYAYYSQKQYLKGVGPLQQAVRLRPEVDGSHYYLGLTQLMLGHKSEAMQQYEELKKLKSDYADKLLSEINKQ